MSNIKKDFKKDVEKRIGKVTEYAEPEILKNIVEPHLKKSRKVVEKDIDLIVTDTVILHKLCLGDSDERIWAYAMHHSQINDDDPLDFFVMVDRQIIINPVITRHSNYTKDSKEACMSFRGMEPVIVQRWQKCEVEYQSIMIDPDNKDKFKLSSVVKESISGQRAEVFQHEVDHGKSKFIYKLNENKK